MRPLLEYTIGEHASVWDAVRVIDKAEAQIALVVDSTKKLLGTVTDGDVRRALLRGHDLQRPVKEIMQRHFRWLPEPATERDALAFMGRHSLRQVPVLDAEGHLIQLHRLEDILKPKSRPNPVVIMAGGKGKRLRPMTDNCPKPMLKINNRPLLEILLLQCVDVGLTEFYFSVGYLKNQIKEYFGDGSVWQVRIRYLEESIPLGTAGPLSLLPVTLNEPVLVLNGDVLTRVDFARLLDFHLEHRSSATVCVREHRSQIPYGVVKTEDIRVVSVIEKPELTHYVNAGVYVLDSNLIQHVPVNTFFDMPSLITDALRCGQVVNAFPIHEYWLDIGLPETLEQAIGDWC